MTSANVADLISLDNPVLKTLIVYEGLLVLKMMAMSLLTGLQRKKDNAFANPEDAAMSNLKVKMSDDVERVRRAHLNDLENIPLFFVASWLYMLTNPSAIIAQNLIRIYTIARFVHTFVYAVFIVPQPARGIAYFVGNLVTGYMTITALINFC